MSLLWGRDFEFSCSAAALIVSLSNHLGFIAHLNCSKAVLPTLQKLSSNWTLVELKMLDVSDRTRTGIFILKCYFSVDAIIVKGYILNENHFLISFLSQNAGYREASLSGVFHARGSLQRYLENDCRWTRRRSLHTPVGQLGMWVDLCSGQEGRRLCPDQSFHELLRCLKRQIPTQKIDRFWGKNAVPRTTYQTRLFKLFYSLNCNQKMAGLSTCQIPNA